MILIEDWRDETELTAMFAHRTVRPMNELIMYGATIHTVDDRRLAK